MPDTLIQDQDRHALASRLSDARAKTDELFSIVRPGALYDRPIPERHRLIFYLGHLEAFDWNLIARRAFGIEPFHPSLDKLFAFGIDPIGGGLPDEPASDWPEAQAVRGYNERVRATVDECLAGAPCPLAGKDLDAAFQMAIEHRLMHAETLAYLLHQLPYESKAPQPSPPLPRAAAGAVARDVVIPAGEATLGRGREEPGFGWDNEFDRTRIHVPEFTIDSHKVSNGRFLEFLRDGGYKRRELWSDAAWEWKTRESVRHPQFWRERDGVWHYRGMFEEVPLPLDAPAYVSHAEASAFARRLQRSLPTEAQFHRAAYGTPEGAERAYPWGDEDPSTVEGNFDLRRWDPTPLGVFPSGDSAFGVSELVGNGWEWTGSVFAPFPGFRAHPDYEGYSANFFDGEHFVQKGGSPRTAACM
ncbi:MAG TPA: SUMF1/EgtB/PvdO family nonheme iron enzyme, partial [Candidatus Binatia bacterium]|nr:SUMF1/EgtB/PvdO family nonheme iron enzyme [Candidatus Binatia bacterium]